MTDMNPSTISHPPAPMVSGFIGWLAASICITFLVFGSVAKASEMNDFKDFFEARCVAAHLNGGKVDVSGLTKMSKKEAKELREGGRATIYSRGGLTQPKLVIEKGDFHGRNTQCTIIYHNANLKEIERYLTTWHRNSTNFREVKELAGSNSETSMRAFDNSGTGLKPIFIISVIVPFLKHINLSVQSDTKLKAVNQ